MSVTCEKTHVKTFHETQRHEMHLLRGAGASRSKRRVDIASSLKFHFYSWLEFSMTFLLSLFFIVSLSFSFFFVFPANVRRNVAKRKHISLHHSTLNLQHIRHSGKAKAGKKKKEKAPERYWMFVAFFFAHFSRFKLSHIDFHIAFFMVNSDDAMISSCLTQSSSLPSRANGAQ